ncbi:MAG: c-type cytochrome [Terriglobales bacterium]
MRECLACHGGDGSGISHAANLRATLVQQQNDGILFWKLTAGNLRRGMPSFPAARDPALATDHFLAHPGVTSAPMAEAHRSPQGHRAVRRGV